MANELDQRFILVENDQFLRAKKANGTEGAIVKLNASDKAEFEAAPVVGGSELTTEVVVDAKVLVETQRAIASEDSIQANVDAEAASRVSGDAALQGSIDLKVSKAGDTMSGDLVLKSTGSGSIALQPNDGAGASYDRLLVKHDDAVSTKEAEFYSGGMYAIDGDQRIDATPGNVYMIDNASGKVTDIYEGKIQLFNNNTDQPILPTEPKDVVVKQYVDNETSATLTSANAYTDSQISIAQGNVSAVEAGLAQEILDRVAADSALQTQIDNVLSNVDGTALNSLSEIVVAFQAADSSLNGAITALSTGLSADIATEEAARIAADSALQGEIDAEEIARAAADTTLQNNINSEASARQSGDDALDARLDVLEAVVFVKEKQVVDATIASSKQVTLGFTPKASSLSVFIGRLALHEGDDYTLSGAVVTFIGTIAGASGIKTGDNLYFTFSK